MSRTGKQGTIKYLEMAVIKELQETYGELFPEWNTILTEALEKIYTNPGGMRNDPNIY